MALLSDLVALQSMINVNAASDVLMMSQLVNVGGLQRLFVCVQKVVSEHDIDNIFCACQDGDDLAVFAYITRDLATEKHYCHVFRVDTIVRLVFSLTTQLFDVPLFISSVILCCWLGGRQGIRPVNTSASKPLGMAVNVG